MRILASGGGAEATPKPCDRFVAFSIAIWSFAGFVIFGYFLLMCYGFSSMVDPELPRPERDQLIAQRFLLGDHFSQLPLIVLFTLGMFYCGISTLIHSVVMVFRWPSIVVSSQVAVLGTLCTSVLFIGYWVFLTL